MTQAQHTNEFTAVTDASLSELVAVPEGEGDEATQTQQLVQRVQTLKNIVTIERQLRRLNEKIAKDLRLRLDSVTLASAAQTAAPRAEGDLTMMAPRQGALLAAPAGTTAHPAALLPLPDRARTSPTQRMPAQVLPNGFKLFEYRIDSVLGQGGFGVTYLATDVNLNTKFAIKEYLPGDFAHRSADYSVFPLWPEDRELYQQGLDSFLIEARTLATFRHPNIVRVARFFEIHHTAYSVLEYENGKSLRDWWLKQASLPEQELLTLLAPLLDGLAVMHANGFLHRDIKPDNIVVRKENGSLVLIDFGSARETVCDTSAFSNVVTPGYAPAEQYAGGQQGPWTDIYAFGATLYWMIAGSKPPPAPTRVDVDPMEPAVQAGKGRYSAQFLAAIDWALKPDPTARPQDIDAFVQALFAAHPSTLGLKEALSVGEPETGSESWAAVWKSPQVVRHTLLRCWRAVTRPASWPMVVKMTLAMLLTSLLPMLMTAHFNWKGSVASLSRSELLNLERIADSAGERVSQLLNDSRNLANFLSADPDFVDLLVHPTEANKASVQAKLDTLVKTIPDVDPIFLLDTSGLGLVSNDREVAGRSYSFREYFKEAMQGHSFMSGMVVGSTAGAPGVYYSNPVRGPTGDVIGVLAMRIKGAAIGTILDGVTKGTARRPFLIDGDGVLIYDSDHSHLYSSLVPLSPEKLARIVADQRFRKSKIDSLDMPELAKATVGTRVPGNITFASPLSGVDEVAGFAPVRAHDWVVGISESHQVFQAPLDNLLRRALYSVVFVGLLFFIFALLFGRSIARPIERLTQAAHALKRGDYEQAHIKVTSNDEIGRLARTFNVMIDVLRQRDRERVRSPENLRRKDEA